MLKCKEIINIIPKTAHIIKEFLSGEGALPFFLKAIEEYNFKIYEQYASDMKLVRKFIARKLSDNPIDPNLFRKYLRSHQKQLLISIISPLVYDQQLARLATKIVTQGMPEIYANIVQEARTTLHENLRLRPMITKNYFYHDIINQLILLSAHRMSPENFLASLSYYQELIPADFFKVILSKLESFVQLHCQQINFYNWLSTKTVTNLLKSINKRFALFKSTATPPKIAKTYSKQLFDIGKLLIEYARKNPGMVIMLGVTVQATAAAALKTSLGLTTQSVANDPENVFLVNNFSLNKHYSPSVVRLSGDNLVVTWTCEYWKQYDSPHWGGFGQLLDKFGTKIHDEFRLFNDTNIAATKAINYNDFLVVWHKTASWPSSPLTCQRFNSQGIPILKPVFFGNGSNNDNFYYSVNTLSTGHFVVAWNSRSAVYAQVFLSNGDIFSPQFAVSNNTQSYVTPLIISLTNGDFMITYGYTYADVSSGFIQRFNSQGVPIGNKLSFDSCNYFSLSVDKYYLNNNFFITWSDLCEENDGIYAQSFDQNGSKLGLKFLLISTSDLVINHKVIEMSNNNLVVVWEELSNLRGKLQGQILTKDYVPFSNRFLIDPTETDNQHDPTLVGLDRCRILVSWQGTKSSLGDSPQIYAAKINVNTPPSLVTNNFEIEQKQSVRITLDMLNVNDPDDSDKDVKFIVGDDIKTSGGYFHYCDADKEIREFTKYELKNGDICFYDDGDIVAPDRFTLTVTDSCGNKLLLSAQIHFHEIPCFYNPSCLWTVVGGVAGPPALIGTAIVVYKCWKRFKNQDPASLPLTTKSNSPNYNTNTHATNPSGFFHHNEQEPEIEEPKKEQEELATLELK